MFFYHNESSDTIAEGIYEYDAQGLRLNASNDFVENEQVHQSDNH